MYWLLLIFYILIIMLVVWLCAGLRWFVHQWGMSMPA